jgi:hypothetical protein
LEKELGVMVVQRGRHVDLGTGGAKPLCLLSGKMRNRQVIEAAFRRAAVQPTVILETDSLFSLYAHVIETGFLQHRAAQFVDFLRYEHSRAGAAAAAAIDVPHRLDRPQPTGAGAHYGRRVGNCARSRFAAAARLGGGLIPPAYP